MKSNRILRFANIFYSLATGEGLPPDSDDLKVVLHNLENLDTYTARKEYAERNLEHLSSGSSRIVYLTPNKTIVKMGRNDKGIAQNRVEANPKMQSQYINKVLSCAKNYAWIEVPYLRKITEKDFKEMTGIDFGDFGESIRYGLREVSGNTDKEKPENFDEIKKSEIYKELCDIGMRFKLLGGDMARISSFGEKNGRPILIDSGLSADVFDKYYEDSSS